jgi:hypothetical protein
MIPSPESDVIDLLFQDMKTAAASKALVAGIELHCIAARVTRHARQACRHGRS